MDVKSDMDLSGKLIIKVQLGDDIRRIPIHNEAITYDELVLMMQRVFRGKLTANDDITIKYKDEDGDLITIFDSSDLSFAIQCSRILKLQILLNNSDGKSDTISILSHTDIIKLKHQLKSIRNQVNKLLDCLDVNEAPVQAIVATTQSAEETHAGDAMNSQNTLNKVNSSEFDPLKDKEQANGTSEEVKETHKSTPAPTPPMASSNKPSQNPGQGVPVPPLPQGVQAAAVSSAASHPNINDYYNRTSTANYPQVAYTSMPYPQQQYTYTGLYGQQVGQQVDPSQVPTSAYSTPQQSGITYTNQQQQYSQPPPGPYQQQQQGVQGQVQGQVNPYSKAYTQPSPQHGYNIPPRQ